MAPDDASITAAQAYEDNLVAPLFGPWAQRVVNLAAPKPGEAVLDLACGTGIGARLVAGLLSPGGRMICADSDAGMVAVAKRTANASGLPFDVTLEWHTSPAEDSIVTDATIDLCLCMQGPQFVTDPPTAMANVFRALKPGGRLAASMWNEMPTNKGHFAIAEALSARGIKPAMKPFSKGNPEDAKALIVDAGFYIESFETGEFLAAFPSVKMFVDGVAAGAPATRHAIAQLSDGDRGAFLADVEATLAPYSTTDGIALPTSAHIILAYRGVDTM